MNEPRQPLRESTNKSLARSRPRLSYAVALVLVERRIALGEHRRKMTRGGLAGIRHTPSNKYRQIPRLAGFDIDYRQVRIGAIHPFRRDYLLVLGSVLLSAAVAAAITAASHLIRSAPSALGLGAAVAVVSIGVALITAPPPERAFLAGLRRRARTALHRRR